MFFQRDRRQFLTIAWNNGPAQSVTVDGIDRMFPTETILPLMVNQTFTFEKPEQIIAWQYLEFEVLSNYNNEVSRRFRITFTLNDKLVEVYNDITSWKLIMV